ncbi:hypothetical protein C4D60_Mb04t33050 [Musa balbisiana]|uniref:Uncharacterized protein n=1 Tax=Musa balbisiana TaxID=52838 RepID=A0A4S8KGE8_MUSBA|nr:hypothetical protein C4D60_Mb04t33050 [Musa balbisiana]
MLHNSSTSISLHCIPSHRATCHSAVLIKHTERKLPPTLKKKRDFASAADADSSPILAVRFATTVSKPSRRKVHSSHPITDDSEKWWSAVW